jgi:hypothetical protein
MGKNLEGSSHGIFKLLSRNSSGEKEEALLRTDGETVEI